MIPTHRFHPRQNNSDAFVEWLQYRRILILKNSLAQHAIASASGASHDSLLSPQKHLAFLFTNHPQTLALTKPKILWSLEVTKCITKSWQVEVDQDLQVSYNYATDSRSDSIIILTKLVQNLIQIDSKLSLVIKIQMEPNQRQSIVFNNANVTVDDIHKIDPTKPIDSIDFTGCQASDDTWAYLISALAKIPLRALSFTNCNLNQNISKCQYLSKLALYKLKKISSLTISKCWIKEATVSLVTQLTNLTQLSIDEYYFTLKLTSQDIQGVGQRKLSIMYQTNLASIPQLPVKRDLESIFECLPNLTELTIEYHAFNNKEFKSMQKLQNLTKLKITGAFEQGKWFSCICQLRNLRQLSIQCCSQAILPIPGRYINDIRNLKYLKKLVLRSKSCDDRRYIFDLKFANAISSLPNVTDLELCHNQFGDDGLEELSKMKSLQVLILDHNLHITQHGLAFLSNLLNLQQLSLQNKSRYSSSINAAGAAHLSKLVNLKKLHLNGNKIGDEGAKHISKMHSLRELYINDNGITDYGAIALCRIPNLEVLSLNINKVGNDSVQELSKLAKLRQISLNSCNFNAVDRLYKVASLRQLAFSSCVDEDRVRVCHIKNPQLKVHIQEFRRRQFW